MSQPRKICIVSEELGGFAGSGGIGSAMEELAACLALNGYLVDFLYTPINYPTEQEINKIYQRMIQIGVKIFFLEKDLYVYEGGETAEKKSYSIYMYLKSLDKIYDIIHFHEYKGLGFCSINAKIQGLDFLQSKIVVQVHGPTRWTIEANNYLFSDPDQLRIDFMEKKCIEKADLLVCPSFYILNWLKENKYKLPSPNNIHVIKNICGLTINNNFRNYEKNKPKRIDEIIIFARHEERKGFMHFCDAIDKIADILSRNQIKITFVGKLGIINGKPSGVIITDRAKKWKFPIDIKCNLNRYEALNYLKNKDNSVIFVPSPIENLPYTVLETVLLHKPVVTSLEGGAGEIIHKDLHKYLLIKINSENISLKILQAIQCGLPDARLAEEIETTKNKWLNFHKDIAKEVVKNITIKSNLPKVALGITHFERPQKLLDAIVTGIKQTYPNLEILVVDDGSKNPETVAHLKKIELLLKRCGGRLIYRENGFLGAARNTIINNTECEYIVFLDDDDLAFPDMVETLVTAAINTDADIVGCFNFCFNEENRDEAITRLDKLRKKLTFAPLGGPLSVSTFENWLGASTSLLKISSLKKIGCYTEIKDVGFEDYELYIRAVQNDLKIEMVPRPLYLYEVGRPSMISNTSPMSNYRRTVKAIDFHKNQDAWRDVINLNTGRKALGEQSNKIYNDWSRDNKKENTLLKMDCGINEYVIKLVKYSEYNGMNYLAKVWQESLEYDMNSSKDESPVYQNTHYIDNYDKISNKNEKTIQNDIYNNIKNVDIILDIKLKRYNDSIEKILNDIDLQNFIDKNLSDTIRMFASSVDAISLRAEINSLMKKIRNARVKNYVKDQILVSLAILAMKIEQRDMLENSIIEMYQEDERDYQLLYPEVHDAINNRKILVSGLQHFKRHGFSEGRNGFSRLLNFCDVFYETTNKKIQPWNIGYILNINILSEAAID